MCVVFSTAARPNPKAESKPLPTERLTVRLLSACAGTTSSELLWLHTSRVSDEQSSVVGDEELSELQGRGGVVVLCVVGDEGLCDGLSDGVDLRGVTTTGDLDADVDGAVREWRRKP